MTEQRDRPGCGRRRRRTAARTWPGARAATRSAGPGARSAPCSPWSTAGIAVGEPRPVHRERRAPSIGRGFRRRRPGVAVLGAERVRDRVRGAARPGGPSGRPDRPPGRVPDRDGRLRGRLRRLRRRARRLGAGRRPGRPGGGRRAAHAGLPRPAAGRGPAGQAGPARSGPGPRSAAPAAALGPVSGARWWRPAGTGCSWSTSPSSPSPLVAGLRVLPLDRSTAHAGRAPERAPPGLLGAAVFTVAIGPWRSRWSRPTTGAGRRRRSSAGRGGGGPAWRCSSAGRRGTRPR